ncbi:MAG TPA: geranylgeranylglyceryl/heptaprenylglyceryl phosphate synthase [Bacteroidetes bacterium]|nr:geranylgeranylglyceryl/heptaprenylglyceryl phosphate synthase [Bacteroidota bacterium]
MNIYRQIQESREKQKLFSVLIDPDRYQQRDLLKMIDQSVETGVDFFLVGGSLISHPIEPVISLIKSHGNIPVLLFPGSLLQISPAADAILLLSLISGRNPEFLIGNHVVAAPLLHRTRMEIIPTGYMLIGNQTSTSVEYISNTRPIPSEKTDIAVATALAGEMLGLKLIYLEAGSGAPGTVPGEMIRQVKDHISVPLIAGGGIRSVKTLESVYRAGADMAVVGNAFENKPGLLKEMAAVKRDFL